MHIWTDIVTRELAMLVTLFALGCGPASFLDRRFGAAGRIAMAPILGLCFGTCIFTTLIWFTSARNTYWLIPIVALISLAVALQRAFAASVSDATTPSRSRIAALCRSLRARDAVSLVVVCLVVAAPLSYTLHERHSVGPIGFGVWDAVGYTAETDGMMRQSIRVAERHNYLTTKNFIERYWQFYAPGDQNLDAAPMSANLDELLGLHATDTQGLFLIAFLIAGALGAFAAMRYFAPKPWWTAPLAGCMFAGPFFLQLMVDGSQAATCGLGVILPLAAVGVDALRKQRLANLALLALLTSGLIALYPLFVPGMVLAAGLVLLVAGATAWWRGQLTRRVLIRAAVCIGVVLALSAIFDLVSFTRDVRYWHDVLKGTYFLPSLPQYHLPYSVLPGWLLQTREFYFLSELGSTTPQQLLLGVILPIIFIAVIVYGIKRRRNALVLVPFVLLFFVMAEYENIAHHCSYCTDRTLLPVAPLSIGLLTLGAATLATAPRHWLRWAGVLVAIAIVVFVGERTRQERLRFADGAYFLDGANKALLSHLPRDPGTVDLEAYGQNPGAGPGELPLVYFLVSEHNGEHVSVASEYADYQGLAYLGGPNPANSQFDPYYRYVLTRIGGVQTGRKLIFRTGPLALEERTGTLDATVVSGVAVPAVRLNPQGLPWVVGPLHLLLSGGGSSPAWISLRFQTIVPVTVPHQAGVTARVTPGLVTACVRATGTAPIRRGTIQLSAPMLPGILPAEPFAAPEPPQGVQLVAVRAVNHCSLT